MESAVHDLDFNELPLPTFFRPETCASWAYEPEPAELLMKAREFAAEHRIARSGSDRLRSHLLLVDMQRDFCLKRGSLFVGGRSGKGAIDDTARLVRFLYRNLPRLTDVTCTLDTHLPFQIFFPSFWVDQHGEHPSPNRSVPLKELQEGLLRPNPAVAWWLCNGNQAWLDRQVKDYCARLEATGRYELFLWPPHCLLGSGGHALVGAVQEARLFHAFCRGAKSFLEVKGGNILTENYSALSPEVLERHDGKPLGQRNESLLASLLESDRLVVAGQAGSHCVRATVEDLVRAFSERGLDPGRIYLLEDCMSAVVVPDGAKDSLADFTDEFYGALESFRAAGVRVVRSTTPMSRWPGWID